MSDLSSEQRVSRPASVADGRTTGSLGADCECVAAQHASRLLHRFSDMLQNSTLTDVTLIAGDVRIPCHRLVLAGCSDYFAAMFQHPMVESGESEIRIYDVDPNALKICVDYMYTGLLSLNEDSVEALLQTAGLLQLTDVVEYCSRFLMAQFHPANCLGIRQFAETQGCHMLYSAANRYTLSHFEEVVSQAEFEQLPLEDFCSLLASDDLNVPSEQTVYEAVLRWTRLGAGESRRCHLSRLLSLVRLPLLSPDFLADRVEPSVPPDCQSLVIEALRYHLLPQRRTLGPRSRPRKSTVGHVIAVGGQYSSKKLLTLEYYEPRSNSWRLLDTMKARRLQFGCAVYDDNIYIVGGRDGLKTLSTVDVYDLRHRIWSTADKMVTPRHGLGVCVLQGPMYAIGGHDGWSYLNTVERWDPSTEQWNLIPHMNSQRSTVGVAVLSGKIYAVGGRDGSQCLQSVEYYDPHTSRWSPAAPMTHRRGGVSVAPFNGCIYAIGGHEASSTYPNASRLDSVERYDPRTDTWTLLAPISSPRDAAGLCALGDRLVVVGGYDGRHYLHDAEYYDTEKQEWSKVAALNSARAGVCLVHVTRLHTRESSLDTSSYTGDSSSTLGPPGGNSLLGGVCPPGLARGHVSAPPEALAGYFGI